MSNELIRQIGQQDIDKEAVYKTPRFWLSIAAAIAAGIVGATASSSLAHQLASIALAALASFGIHANAVAVPPRRLWSEEMRAEMRKATSHDEVAVIKAKYSEDK